MVAFRTEWDTEANPRYDVWSTVNGGEVIPGVLTPFAATWFNRFDAITLRLLMAPYPNGRRMTIFDPPVGNFWGVSAGRLTLNVGFTVAAMSCLDPDIAATMASQFFEGSDEARRLLVDCPPEEVAAAMTVATAQRDAAEAESRAAQEALYEERMTDRATHDRALPLKKAWRRFHDLVPSTAELLARHYVVSTAAGEARVRLAGAVADGGGDPATVVGLCSGLGDLESAQPVLRLHQLAMVARRHASVRKVVESGDIDTMLARLADPPDRGWQAFADEFDELVFRYGFRGQGEADPTVPDWSEEPHFVLSQVRSMMALGPDGSPAAHQKRAVAARVALERSVRASLAASARDGFDTALAQAQRFTALRELTKAVWVLGTRRMRPPLLAVADGLVAAGDLANPGDLLWCTYAEVEAMVKGHAVTVEPAITRRRHEHQRAEEHVLPDSWVGTATPTLRRRRAAARSIAGVGVSPGVASGPARVILGAEAAFARDIEPGDVLVAPFTDTPWTPLFLPAAAVVVETGSVLSHAATVAREFGVPCVVQVHDATLLVADGDLVTVDGGTGTVTIDPRS